MERDRPHLYLYGGSEKDPFTSPKSGPRRSLAIRDREAHSAHLIHAVQSATLLASTNADLSLPQGATNPGLLLEFAVPRAQAIALDSLENNRKGIELLSIRESDPENL